MEKLQKIRRLIAAPLAVLMTLSLLWPPVAAQAAMVGSDRVIESESATAGRQRIESLLSRDEVRSQMVEMGVNPDEATDRVAAMSDAEVLALAQQIDDLPAGQAVDSGTLIVVLLLIIILALVL